MEFDNTQDGLIRDDLFDQLVQAYTYMDKRDGDNKCPNCKVDMNIIRSEYTCTQCGYTIALLTECYSEKEDTVGGTIRIASGTRKGRLYTISGTGNQLRRRVTMSELLQRQAAFTGNIFPLDVLSDVANLYSAIQTKYVDVTNDKFVHRAAIKNELYAGLIKFECIRRGIPRKNKEIAKFMGLTTSGFATGENILRKLQKQGIADIVVEEDPLTGYLDRYLDALDMRDPRYRLFVIDIVSHSEKHYLGMQSQISSKVVGALFILIEKCQLPIFDYQLERATDNTKKNTFMKFYNLVMTHLCVFVNIFNRYNIPYTTGAINNV